MITASVTINDLFDSGDGPINIEASDEIIVGIGGSLRSSNTAVRLDSVNGVFLHTNATIATSGGSVTIVVNSGPVLMIFGAVFADRVTELPPGAWHGPVQSGYGLHLVFVHARSEPRLPDLAEVEQKVRDEWRAARRREVNEAVFAKLLEGYEVVIEEPAPPRTAARAGDETGTP